MLLGFLVLLASCGGGHDESFFTSSSESTPPSLEISPKGVSVAVGESLRFTASLEGPNSIAPVLWSATGGSIDQTGLFSAGQQPGNFQVHAEVATPLGVVTDVADGLVVSDSSEVESGAYQDTTTTIDPSTILFEANFESGDFRNWSNIAPAGDPVWSGIGGGGAHIGDGYITDEQVHSGKRAWKALIDPSRESSFDDGTPWKSSLARWDFMKGISEFYISAWYYVPTNYPAVSTALMQAKGSDGGEPMSFRMIQSRELIVRSDIGSSRTLAKTGVAAPLGRWFNLTARFVIADSGLIELWLDGRKIASVRTDTKDSDYYYPGIANYLTSSQYPVKCHIYIDDVTITTGPPQ